MPVGDRPVALAVGDVNLDLVRDIVSADADSKTVSVRLGSHEGNFTAAPFDQASVEGTPAAVAIGAIDSEGWADLAVTFDDGVVRMVRLDPEATPAVTTIGVPVPGARAPIISDFVDDARGLSDIAVLGDDGIHVARQTDPGVFDTAWVDTHIPAPSDLIAVRNASGTPTVAYVGMVENDEIGAFDRGNNGTFSSGAGIGVGPRPRRFTLADLNGDAYTDVLSAGDDGGLWLSRGKSNGIGADGGSPDESPYAKPELVYQLGWVPLAIATTSLDEDDDLEVLVLGPAQAERRDLYLFDNDGDGRLIYGGSLGMTDASDFTIADLDRDMVPELLVASADHDEIAIARRAGAMGPGGGTGGSTAAVVTSGPTEESGPLDTIGPVETSISPDATGDPFCGLTVALGSNLFSECSALPISAFATAFADVTGEGTPDAIFLTGDPSSAVLEVWNGIAAEFGTEYEPQVFNGVGVAENLWGLDAPRRLGAGSVAYASAEGVALVGPDFMDAIAPVHSSEGPLLGVTRVMEFLPPDTGGVPIPHLRLALLAENKVFVTVPLAPEVYANGTIAAQSVYGGTEDISWVATAAWPFDTALGTELIVANRSLGGLFVLGEVAGGDWQSAPLVDGLEQPGEFLAPPMVLGEGEIALGFVVLTPSGVWVQGPTEQDVRQIAFLSGARRLRLADVDSDGLWDVLLLARPDEMSADHPCVILDVFGAGNSVCVPDYAGAQDVRTAPAPYAFGDAAREIWIALPDRVARLTNYL